MARRFFYICAGMLMLALSYGLGSRQAAAQVGGQVSVGEIDHYHEFGMVAVVGRILYQATVRGPISNVSASAPVPGSSPIVAVESQGPAAMLANGDVYAGTGNVPCTSWTYIGNMLIGGTPTPALHESWGQLKSRYAPQGGTVSKGADTR